MFWDGRVSRDNATGALTTPESTLNGITPARADVASQLTSALAAQAMFPVASDVEMRGAVGNEIRAAADNQAVWAALMARLVGTNNGTTGGMAAYRSLFNAAYPGVAYDDLNFGHAARAIAAFETASYAAIHSPLDEFLRGNPNALSADAKAGGLLFFGRAGCGGCHRGPLLSDANFHGIAAPQLGPGASGGDDQGRFLISGSANDNYHFRTPALRNVELTAPYTHAGAYTTLAAVIAHKQWRPLTAELQRGKIDLGHFLAHNRLTQRVAFDQYTFAGDWDYINRLQATTKRKTKVAGTLFVHN
jgi:cytochrome c peroxidase